VNVLLVAVGIAPQPVAGALGEVAGVRGIEVAALPEPAGRDELDPVLDGLAGRRLVLAGSPAAIGDVLTRLRRRDELAATPVGVILPNRHHHGLGPLPELDRHRPRPSAPERAGPAGRAGLAEQDARGEQAGLAGPAEQAEQAEQAEFAGLMGPAGPAPEQAGLTEQAGLVAAARIAATGVPRPVDLVRDDHGGVLVDRAELAGWHGGRLGMRAYADDTRVADGEVGGLVVVRTGAGVLHAQVRPVRRWWTAGPGRPSRGSAAAGRAVQLSCAEARLTVDGRAHPRPVTRRTWWVEPAGWLLVSQA
jgi:hypothetical protein